MCTSRSNGEFWFLDFIARLECLLAIIRIKTRTYMIENRLIVVGNYDQSHRGTKCLVDTHETISSRSFIKQRYYEVSISNQKSGQNCVQSYKKKSSRKKHSQRNKYNRNSSQRRSQVSMKKKKYNASSLWFALVKLLALIRMWTRIFIHFHVYFHSYTGFFGAEKM